MLDPACGSGTFLFHAIRNFIREAEEAGLDEALQAQEATNHIAGIDVHPVAVIIARVTYLLALAPVITKRAGSLSIPVYLGDALQLSTATTMHLKELVIHVPPPPEGADLKFPEIFCKEIHLFDKLVARMRQGSEQGMSARQIEPAFNLEVERHYKRDMTKEEEEAVREMVVTYTIFDVLRREGRDSVWTYVARNLSRPLALSFGAGWANVVVGNPPWVAFRHMSADLQIRFRELAQAEGIFVGRVPSQNDLCALFTVRSAMLYLRSGGRIAFVLPLAVLSRNQFQPLRAGSFSSGNLAWDEVWTMSDGVQPLFPVPSCVVFGRRRAAQRAMPNTVRAYTGTLPLRDAPESVADSCLSTNDAAPALAVARHKGGSIYRERFRNGATLFPRMLCFAERQNVGRLGSDPSAPFVISRRSSQEKRPWKLLPSLEHRVETEFIYPVLLGESILPYRIFRPFEAVLPITARGEMLDAQAAANRGFSELNGWMNLAEKLWLDNRRSDMTLVEMFDYFGQLTAQFPVRSLRVVYAKAGMQPAACILRNRTEIIENTLYWHAVPGENEALFLVAILNSETARQRVERYQARGQWGARHFDKAMFNLPIPRFEAGSTQQNPLPNLSAARHRRFLHASEVMTRWRNISPRGNFRFTT